MSNLDFLLRQMTERGASDLHLKVGRPPTLRVNGERLFVNLTYVAFTSQIEGPIPF